MTTTQHATPQTPHAPQSGERVLLHVCCAPCSCVILERMKEAELCPSILFYNPNIHPEKEYERRKAEVIRFALIHDIPFFDADYDVQNWMTKTKGLEAVPERGRRCDVCFTMRLSYTAAFAKAKGFSWFATSLSISRQKDQAQVHRAGHLAAQEGGPAFWDCNWRQQGGLARGAELSREMGFYRQDYCGCLYSRRLK
ncbi:MAG: epoxyqueuosine reductase QueH [Alphaproteobacteria bacterium]|nr:epoxyqueuosine reductase QueH [Alphaproteobacteria bacterium]